MDNKIPLLILMIIPILMVFRMLYYMFDTRTIEIKAARCVSDLTFSDYKTGYYTNGFFNRFVNLFIIYFSFLSIFDLASLFPHLIITTLILIAGFFLNCDCRVFGFTNNSFSIRKYIGLMGTQIEFSYSDIDKIEYYIAGRGTAQIRIYLKGGIRKKISFRPSFYGQDAKLIQLILKEKVEFEIKNFRLKNIIN